MKELKKAKERMKKENDVRKKKKKATRKTVSFLHYLTRFGLRELNTVYPLGMTFIPNEKKTWEQNYNSLLLSVPFIYMNK